MRIKGRSSIPPSTRPSVRFRAYRPDLSRLARDEVTGFYTLVRRRTYDAAPQTDEGGAERERDIGRELGRTHAALEAALMPRKASLRARMKRELKRHDKRGTK